MTLQISMLRGVTLCLALAFVAISSVNAGTQATHKPAPTADQSYDPFVLTSFQGKPNESTEWRTTLESQQPKTGQFIPLSSGIFVGVPSAGFQTAFSMDSSDGGMKMHSTWQQNGAEHVFIGKVQFAGFEFESDPTFPLTFQVTTSGYQSLCGKGTIQLAPGKTQNIAGNDFRTWLSCSSDPRALVRQGAAEALGWLAISDEEKKQALKALTLALKDSDPKVRRDAAEALGKIGVASDAKSALDAALRVENDARVIKVIKEVSAPR